MNHSSVGKSTHSSGTAGAHEEYVEEEEKCSVLFGEHMPTERGGAARRWLDEQEAKDRKNARVIDKFRLALPRELTREQNVELVKSFMDELGGGNVPWIAGFHDMRGNDLNNPHCHLIVRDRHFETGKRSIGLSEKGSTERAREIWERCTNVALAKAGHDERVDRRSLKAQRAEMLEMEKRHREYQPELADQFAARAEALNRKPQGHEGPVAREIERKGRRSHKLERIRAARRGPESAVDARRGRQEPQTTLTPSEPPKTSLRAVFEAIISPEGYGGRLWAALERWGLVNLTREEVASDLVAEVAQDTALVRYAMKDRHDRLRILDDLGQPHDLDTGEAERARILSGFSPVAYDPEPHPAPTVAPPSRSATSASAPEPEQDQPKPQAPPRSSGWSGPSRP